MKFLALFLFTSTLIFSQGEYIHDDSFGIGFSYNYSASDRYTANGFSGGFSILGKFDIAFDYVRSTFQTNSAGVIKSTGTSLYMAYNSKPNLKTNLKFLFGYLSGSGGSGIMLGLALAVKVVESEAILIMPGLGFTAGFVSVGRGSYSKVVSASSVTFGIDFAANLSEVVKIIVAPTISKSFELSESPVAGGISVGILLTPPIDSSLEE